MMARNFSNMLKDTSTKFHMTNNQPASRQFKYRIICPLEKGEYLKKKKIRRFEKQAEAMVKKRLPSNERRLAGWQQQWKPGEWSPVVSKN